MKHPIFIAALLCLLVEIVAADDVVYTVEKGDTLYSIAHEYGVTLTALMEANGVKDPTTLSVGTRLIIPQVYIVQKGDTLWAIAHAYGLTVYELRDLNGFPEGYADLKEGDTLVVPAEIDSQESDSEIALESETTGVVDSEEIPAESSNASSDPPYWPHNGEKRTREGKFQGLEFVGNIGDVVYAVTTGTVVWNAPYRPFDWLVIVESDDDYQFVYGITDAVLVNINDRVTAGAEIGTLGLDPSTGEALLFFSVLKNGEIVDPESAPRG